MYVFNDGQWQDFGTQEYYGTLIMKVCLTDFQLEDYSLTFLPANGYSECGKNVIGEVTVKSNSNKAVENFTYTITVGNGEAEEKTFGFMPVGYGQQDIPSILQASLDAGGKWVVVEQDASDERPPLEAIAMSREYLKKQGW